MIQRRLCQHYQRRLLAPSCQWTPTSTRSRKIQFGLGSRYPNSSSAALSGLLTSTESVQNQNQTQTQHETKNERNDEDYKNIWKAWFSSPEYQPTYSIPPVSVGRTTTSSGTTTSSRISGVAKAKSKTKSRLNNIKHQHQSIIQLENIHLDNMTKSLLLMLQHVSNNFITTQHEQQYLNLGGEKNLKYPSHVNNLNQELHVLRKQRIAFEHYDYPTTERCNSLLSTLLTGPGPGPGPKSSMNSSLNQNVSISPSSKTQLAFQLFYLMNYITTIKKNISINVHANTNVNASTNGNSISQKPPISISRPNYDTYLKVLQLHSQESINVNVGDDVDDNNDNNNNAITFYYSQKEEGEDILRLVEENKYSGSDFNSHNAGGGEKGGIPAAASVIKQTSIWSSTAKRALYVLNVMKQQQNEIANTSLVDRVRVDVVIYNQVLATVANSFLLTKARCCEALLREMAMGTYTAPDSESYKNTKGMVDVSSYGYVFKACATTATANNRNIIYDDNGEDNDDYDYDCDDGLHQIDAGKIALRTWKSFESSELLREMISSLSNSTHDDNDKESNPSMHRSNNNMKDISLGKIRGPQMIAYAMKSLPFIQKANEHNRSVEEADKKNAEGASRIDVNELCLKQFDVACRLGWINSHVLLAMDETLPRSMMNELLFDKYTESIYSDGNIGKEMTREYQCGHLFKHIPEEWRRNTDNVNRWGYQKKRNVSTK